MLVQKWREAHSDGEDQEIRAKISRAVDSSRSLRNKKDLIENFVDSVSATGEIDDEWRAYVAAQREAELKEIIGAEDLCPHEKHAFIDAALRDGAIQTTGTAITKGLPPVPRFAAGGACRSNRTALGVRCADGFPSGVRTEASRSGSCRSASRAGVLWPGDRRTARVR